MNFNTKRIRRRAMSMADWVVWIERHWGGVQDHHLSCWTGSLKTISSEGQEWIWFLPLRPALAGHRALRTRAQFPKHAPAKKIPPLLTVWMIPQHLPKVLILLVLSGLLMHTGPSLPSMFTEEWIRMCTHAEAVFASCSLGCTPVHKGAINTPKSW